MDFALPADLVAYLDELDRFIAREIKPLEQADDNIRFFDHRREWARTDFDKDGLPRPEWEALLEKAAYPSLVAHRIEHQHFINKVDQPRQDIATRKGSSVTS